MIKPRTWIGAMILPALLGCPGTGGDPAPSPPNPGEKVLAWQYNGSKQAVAGSYGITWQIFASPQVFGSGRLHLNGPGTLTDLLRNPLDLSSSDLDGQGWYVPPAIVPAGGATVYLSAERRAPYTNAWETSPQYPIKVVQQTTPMVYEYVSGHPHEATLKAGETYDFGSQVTPRPLDFQQSLSIIPGVGAPSDVGSVGAFTEVDPSAFKFQCTAPATVTTAFDITIRATAHDPWMNLDPYLDFTVHLVP